MSSTLSYQFVRVNYGSHPLQVRYVEMGQGDPILFLHGWGTGLYTFLGMMELMQGDGRLVALDFPGFGESEVPHDVWGTEEYAAFTVQFAKQLGIERCTLISHSFGGRVSMRMALQQPQLVTNMAMIAAAGIKRQQSFFKKMRIRTIQTLAKTAGAMLPSFIGMPIKQKLYSLIASPDYLQAGALKNIFVKVVNEDMKDVLPTISVPTLLLYGSDDAMTPPEVGKLLRDGISNSSYIEFPGFDHNTILERGRHQVCHQIQQWLSTQAESLYAD